MVTEFISVDSIKIMQDKVLTNQIIDFVSKWNFEKPKKEYIGNCTDICGCGYFATRIVFNNKISKIECYHFYADFLNNNLEFYNIMRTSKDLSDYINQK